MFKQPRFTSLLLYMKEQGDIGFSPDSYTRHLNVYCLRTRSLSEDKKHFN